MRLRLMRTVLIVAAMSVVGTAQNKRDDAVRKDRETVEPAGKWIYHDLPRGLAEAKRSGRPVLVVFR